MMNRTAQSPFSTQQRGARRSLALISVFSLLLSLPSLLNAAATANLDRQTIYTGDTTTLHITTSGDDTGQQPDLAPLQKDFDVLGTSSSSQIRIINGQRSDKHEWLIELAPRAKGNITIPALTVGNSKTAPLTLQVTEQPAVATAQAGQPVFIRSEINPPKGNTYVQQQIVYTTRLYYRVPLIEGSFTDPKIDNAVVEQLGEDKQYETTLDGQGYQVVERRYAVFPEHSGELNIAPTVFNGRTVAASGQHSISRRMDSMIEQMMSQNGFNDRFFSGTPFGDPGKRIRLASNSLTLDVKPRPESFHGKHWLPTQKMLLKDSWASSPPVIHAGEPVTRTLTLEAKGLEASQLPTIQLAGSDSLRIYPEQPTLSNRTDGDWVFGRSEQQFAYVASQPGKLHFPAVQISWWDTLKHKQQITELPAHDITVLPGTGKATAPIDNNTTQSAANTANSNTPTQTNNTDATTTPMTQANTTTRYWLLGAVIGVVVLALVALIVIRRYRKSPSPAAQVKPVSQPTTTATNQVRANASSARIRQTLREACTKSDPQAAANALLAWAAATWPDQPPRSLGALAGRVHQGAEFIRELETVLYGAKDQNWSGLSLWKAFAGGLVKDSKTTASTQNPDGAPPLYPDWRKQAG